MEKAIPIAGDYSGTYGGSLDPHWTRLKTSDVLEDREKEGLRLSMEGGSRKKPKRAIVTFLCPAKDKGKSQLRRDEDDEIGEGNNDDEGPDNDEPIGEEVDDGEGGRLKFVSYAMEEKVEVLRLDWVTKYACEDFTGEDQDKSSLGHWGFFTWLIIM